MKEKKELKINSKELAWLITSGVFLLTAFIFFIFYFVEQGIIAAGVKNDLNVLLQADKAMLNATKLGWLYWGLIALAIGVIVLVITLDYWARKNEKSVDREKRRKDKTFNISEDSVRQAVETKEEAAQ